MDGVTMDGVDRKRCIQAEDVMDTSETLPGNMYRASVGDAGGSEELLGTEGERRRVADPRLSFVVHNEGVNGRPRLRNPALDARWRATYASAAEGADAAISAWTADECEEALGQEVSADEDELHKNSAHAVEELCSRGCSRLRRRSSSSLSQLLLRALVGCSLGSWSNEKTIRKLARWPQGTKTWI